MLEDLWYKNAIVYSLDIETFVDGNGDGIGDIDGLIRRLDYLVTLGVDVIWLAPFHPSPNRDDGYDVRDYYGVDARLGTPGEIVELIHQAQKRGLKIVMDLVVNHTSDEHPWFQASRRRDPRYADFYLWSKKRPPNWNEGMVFPGVQRATWTRDVERNEYYFHRFHPFQPDLNIDNPEVRTEIRRIMGFWVQLGVDGFRVDAVPFVIEHPDLEQPTAPPAMHFDYIEELREFLQWRGGPAVLLGEANVRPDESREYFRGGRGLHLMFNFWVNQHLFLTLATGRASHLAEALEATRERPHTAQWAQFLRNHDELDLGRLSDDDRATVFERFGPDESMQLFGRGLRRRLAPMLGTRARLELAYSLLFALPGTPVLRYGDEIGMGEHLALRGRDAVRTPMQWSSHPSAGFSTATELVHPVIDFGPYDYRHVNVEDQRRDPSSLLRWTARMIRVRKECPEIGWGRCEVLDAGSPHVLALLCEWRGSAVLTLHNFADHPEGVRLAVPMEGGERLVDLMHTGSSRASDGVHQVVLEAYGYRWYRVGDLNYALHRAKETPRLDADPPARNPRPHRNGATPRAKRARRT